MTSWTFGLGARPKQPLWSVFEDIRRLPVSPATRGNARTYLPRLARIAARERPVSSLAFRAKTAISGPGKPTIRILADADMGLVRMDNELIASDESDYLSLGQVTRLIPGRCDKRISLKTVHRWCSRGLGGGIRLRSVKIGGKRCTTLKWLREFIDASNRGGSAPNHPPLLRTPQQRQTASERAAADVMAPWYEKES
jgi:hypothetical protein